MNCDRTSDKDVKYTISIICPCYNGENHIMGALNSFIWQKNPFIELIVIDDGSTDKTLAILEEYQRNYNNIKVISVPNGGAGKARNIGIESAKGQWICFLDSDDMLVQNCFENSRLLWLKQQAINGVEIICTPMCKSDMLLNWVKIVMPEQIKSIKHNIPQLAFWTCIYKKGFIINNKIRFYEYKKQDIETAFRYKAFSSAQKSIVNNDFRFYIHRDNLNSNTHTWNRFALYSIKSIVYYDLFENTNVSEDKAFLFNIALEHIFFFYGACAKYGKPEKKLLESVHELFLKMKKVAQADELLKCDRQIKKRIFAINAVDTSRYIFQWRCGNRFNKEYENINQQSDFVISDWIRISNSIISQ